MNRNYTLIAAGVVAAIAAVALLNPDRDDSAAASAPLDGSAMVAVSLPSLDANAAVGQRIFEAKCAACHGVNAAGNQEAGPPLIHVIYEPGHHADEAFQRAVASGVRAHHWGFGEMQPVDGLTRADVEMVISYIRTVQRANGIN